MQESAAQGEMHTSLMQAYCMIGGYEPQTGCGCTAPHVSSKLCGSRWDRRADFKIRDNPQ